MRIRVGYDITFEVPSPTPVLMMLRVHPTRESRLETPETPSVGPNLAVSEYVDTYGNRAMRVLAPAGKLRFTNDVIVGDDGLPDAVVTEARQHPVNELPAEVLQFLLASRYCEVDRLGTVAWNLFSNAPTGWGRVQAICSWVHHHVQFGYHFARSTKTAHDVYIEANGVCRDFTHLAITFCRCMNIPARYATGYLGDFGVPPSPDPMDFSAWFEAYLGGRWHTFDARHNRPRVGRVLMAYGRDAVDVALTTSFGPTILENFVVWSDEL